MKFVVLLEGNGNDWCDYSIGCNKKWEFVEVESLVEANKKVLELLEDQSNFKDGCGIAKATIIEIANSYKVDVVKYWRDVEDNYRAEKEEREQKKRKE